MIQWLFTLFAAINKMAKAVLTVAEAVDATAHSLREAALDSIEDSDAKEKIRNQNEFDRYSSQTKSTLKSLEEWEAKKQSKQSKQPKQQQQ